MAGKCRPAQVQKIAVDSIATPRISDIRVATTPGKVSSAVKSSGASTKVSKPVKEASSESKTETEDVKENGKKAIASPKSKTEPKTYLEMALLACQNLKSRKGCSLSAIAKYVVQEFPVKVLLAFFFLYLS